MKPIVCVAGKNRIAVDVLHGSRRLCDAEVVCLPSTTDTGVDDWQPSLRKAARRSGIKIVDIAEILQEPGLCFLSVEYDKIIKPAQFASKRLFNLHFSLLPKYRGCHPVMWPILRGETEHGVTLQVIDAGIDSGDIIAQERFRIAGMTARDLYMRCMEVGARLVLEWLPRLVSGDYPVTPQVEAEASHHWRKDMDFTLKEIDVTQSTDAVMRRVRAFTFPEYQLPTFRGRRILNAEPVIDVGESGGGLRGDTAVIATADGFIRLTFASPEALTSSSALV